MKKEKKQPEEKGKEIHEEQHLHQKTSVKRQAIVSIGITFVLLAFTVLAILYGKGYRLGFQQGEPKVSKTGILHVTSVPNGTQVYIDGHLTTADNNSINLTPGKYTVRVSKDGYTDWQKDFDIKKEVVSNAEAVLFPKAPTLQSISTFGINSVSIDPAGTKLAFKISSQSAKRNGIYVLDLTSNNFQVLAGQSSSTQLANDATDLFSQANLTWSPDGKQLLASISGQLKTAPTYYLLKADGMNDTPQDVTATLPSILDVWKNQRADKETALLKTLKPAVRDYAKKNFNIISWSPDESKILYQASQSANMPVFLNPRLIGNNNLYERRDLKKGAIYVYNIQEDINTRLIDSTDETCTIDIENCVTPFRWFPDSTHLTYVHDNKIEITEDDGSNMTTIYAGPFVDHYVYPWSDSSKIVILTNLNNVSVPPTLYTIGLK